MKIIVIKKEKILIFLFTTIVLYAIVFLNNKKTVETFYMPVSKKVIVIDSGHGGWDPGKVADNNTLEKDINLEISKKLQSYLEQGDCTVLLTRAMDEALGKTKKEDMSGRITIANNTNSDLFISIHQNAYTDERVIGAQVFYFNTSENSKKLAKYIQEQLNTIINTDRPKEEKENKNYYILKKSNIPSVIVECGFLSNSIEKEKLLDDDYQNKIAWAIYKGISNYYNMDSVKKN